MPINTDQQERYISIWSKAIDTQMHFNEMSVKSRQLGLTFVAAALGVGVVLLSRGDDFAFPLPFASYKFQLHITVLLLLGACLALAAVRNLDLNVYHKMLRGAVTFGEDFEENYMKQIFKLDKGMTQAISHYSRSINADKEKRKNGKYAYIGGTDVSAETKIRLFYRTTIQFLLVGAVAVFLATNAPATIKVYTDYQSHRVQSSPVDKPKTQMPSNEEKVKMPSNDKK